MPVRNGWSAVSQLGPRSDRSSGSSLCAWSRLLSRRQSSKVTSRKQEDPIRGRRIGDTRDAPPQSCRTTLSSGLCHGGTCSLVAVTQLVPGPSGDKRLARPSPRRDCGMLPGVRVPPIGCAARRKPLTSLKFGWCDLYNARLRRIRWECGMGNPLGVEG